MRVRLRAFVELRYGELGQRLINATTRAKLRGSGGSQHLDTFVKCAKSQQYRNDSFKSSEVVQDMADFATEVRVQGPERLQRLA